MLSSSPAATGGPLRFYIGTYTEGNSTSEGIYTGTLDPATGRLGPLVPAARADNPNFLALSPDGRFLYAALGLAHDEVGAFAIGAGGMLRHLGNQNARGAGVCHVSIAGTGRHLFAANYSSGTVAGFSLGAAGGIEPAAGHAAFRGSGPHLARQKGPHAHSIYASPDGAHVYACDLGTDRVWIFRRHEATGALMPAGIPFAVVPAGGGPRHLAFGAEGSRVYVANELDCTVTVFSRDAETGTLTELQTGSSLPPGTPRDGVTSAEIAMHPDGRRLYVSNRGVDTLAVFEVGEDGRIDLAQTAPAEVRMPRHFAIDPTGRWLLAAGQEDHRLAVLRIDPDDGKLAATGETATVAVPVCVVFERGS